MEERTNENTILK